jgi:hypothetical protein
MWNYQSKVIAHPPSADAACRRRCGNWRGRAGVLILHLVAERKQKVLGARDAEGGPAPGKAAAPAGAGHAPQDRVW